MIVRFGVEALGEEWPSCIVCIGTFDGVHLGHQEVIRTSVEIAERNEEPAVVLTFDRHPMAVLAPQKCPPAVGTLGIDLNEFEKLGVAATIVLQFDDRLANTTADDFFEHVLRKKLKAKQMVVGHDFAFGKNRMGTPVWLKERIETTVVPPFELNSARVSSTSIRTAVQEGQVETAAKLLGRPWSQEGIIVAGQRLGREIGFPTLNLAPASNQVTPKNGVYAGHAETRYGTYKAAIGVGVRPTVGGGPRTFEAFLIDYPGTSLYGSDVRLSYRRLLREEVKYETIDLLKEQMAKDVEATRTSDL
jgi:riboflavin kinase/FMN adenylyltransferase